MDVAKTKEEEDSYDEREEEFGIIVFSDLRIFLHVFRMCLVIIID
jgi:hypothetical protein